MKPSDPVAITALAVTSPLGNDFDAFCEKLFQGECGIRAIQGLDLDGLSLRFAGQLPARPVFQKLSGSDAPYYSELSLMTLDLADRVFASRLGPGKNIDSIFDPRRVGCVIGSGMLNLHDLEPFYKSFYERGPRAVNPLTVPLNIGSAPTSRVSIHFGLAGLLNTVTTACASGLSAIHQALESIRSGTQDAVLAGGVELTSSRTIYTAWERMRALSAERENPRRACRPFESGRTGLVLGEGGALFLLENFSAAKKSGAPILGVSEGSGFSADHRDMVKPSPEGIGRCLVSALEDARWTKDEVGMIQTHGTGTPLNDSAEYEAMEKIWGERMPTLPVSAIKWSLGHSLGASGALSLAAALGTLKKGCHYPAPERAAPDPATPVFLPREGEFVKNRKVLVNAFAFGGVNHTLAVAPAPD
ncbi:MAG: beta-ketoacyl-[acyl-carrier-protein] synthase family protein [Spirochaetia bacterium]|nr:beta-ketoacyl-[acyl-carrier-protein] synthase family protein [Spirochaetia bacterium]